jgi:hypothetical protein
MMVLDLVRERREVVVARQVSDFDGLIYWWGAGRGRTLMGNRRSGRRKSRMRCCIRLL